MTPDMKRLCEAVCEFDIGGGLHEVPIDDVYTAIALTPSAAEAIVRAVLMALREPSEAMEGAARANVPNDFERWAPATEFATMIDAILADPVKA